jgi:hypothetical protein
MRHCNTCQNSDNAVILLISTFEWRKKCGGRGKGSKGTADPGAVMRHTNAPRQLQMTAAFQIHAPPVRASGISLCHVPGPQITAHPGTPPAQTHSAQGYSTHTAQAYVHMWPLALEHTLRYSRSVVFRSDSGVVYSSLSSGSSLASSARTARRPSSDVALFHTCRWGVAAVGRDINRRSERTYDVKASVAAAR